MWSMALKERDAAKALSEEERTLFFLGGKSAGKTTLIDRFLERPPDVPKPTTALEYRYSRRTKNFDQGRDLVHIWELAGGASLAKLVDSVLTAGTLRTVGLVFVVDLSAPQDLWPTLDGLLKAVRLRIEKVISDSASRDPKLAQQLKKKASAKHGDDHVDREWLTPLPATALIVGTKYDKFQALETDKRRLVCNALRYLAHVNGASLAFVSDKDETLLARLRGILSYIAFKTSAPGRVVAIDPARPLLVPVGSDNLAQIGTPPASSASDAGQSAKRITEMWGSALAVAFPADAARQEADPGAREQFAEAAVDAMRAQKSEELEKYRREAERKAHELAQRLQVESNEPVDGDKREGSRSTRSRAPSAARTRK